MSDDWRFFPCTIGESSAFTFVDIGIAKTIGSAPTNLVKARLKYKSPAPNGLPTHEEFEAVRSIEDALEKLATETSSWYVGRVTVAGHRDFFVYSWHAAARWQPFVNALAAQTGYELEASFRDDPQHEGYWHDLYPTDDDWRVIHDLEVLDQLRKRGDDGRAERQIDHWVYFDNEKAATEFVTWAETDSFTHDTKYSRVTDEGTYCVRLQHIGPATIESVSRRSITLRRKAREHGGKYDGWETPVLTG
jgi:hypothetical protein